jgi:hypothetical protein
MKDFCAADGCRTSTFAVRKTRFLALLLAFGLLVVPTHTPASRADSATTAQDGSDANSALAQTGEKLALQILKTPAMKTAIAKALHDFETSDMANKPDGLRYVKSAVDEAAFYASLHAAMGNLPDPVFFWSSGSPRKWNGYTLPGCRWFADNADTLYRGALVDDTSTYEVNLHVGKTLPAQLSVLVYNWLMLETGASAQGDVPLAAIEVTETTPRNPDGSITLLVGPEPANGRPNYLQLKPGAKQIYIREIRGDGSLPAVGLSVKRTSGAARKGKSLDELGEEAAVYLAAGVVATNNVTKVFGELKENELGTVRVRWAEDATSTEKKMVTDEVLRPDQAVGFISSGLFNLKEDEALVMTLKTMGTKYVGVNTYRPFLLSPENVYGSSSLNNYQSKVNPDGSITLVLARKDPGVYNWLDVAGIPYGFIAVRWQGLTHPVAGTSANGIESVKVVKVSDLKTELPPTTVWVTPAEREEQRANRASQYMLRCLGTPCEAGGDLDKPY